MKEKIDTKKMLPRSASPFVGVFSKESMPEKYFDPDEEVKSMKKHNFFLLLMSAAALFLMSGNILMAQQDAQQQEDFNQGEPDIGQEFQGGGFRGQLINFDTLGQGDPDTDLYNLIHWDVQLNASASYIPNVKRTYSKVARGRSGKNFIGIRAFFPNIDANSFASVRPRNTIGFYDIATGLPAEAQGRGVLTNVAAIKQAFVRVAGRNYEHLLMVDIMKNTGEKIRFDFGSLKFAGWQTLTWSNPRYQSDYRDRVTILTPLYPRLIPSVKFDNLIIFRSYDQEAGNFIGYVDWIDLQYDKAYADAELDEIRNEEDAIDDEEVWSIIRRETGGAEARLLQKKLRDFRRLERIEKLKMNIPVDSPAAAPAPAANNQGVNQQPAAQ